MNKAKVVSVNISEKKGTIKKPMESIELYDKGVKDDAHSGNWQRQVSLLAAESVRKFEKEAQRSIRFGEFAENITTEGVTLHETTPLDRIFIGDTELEITQIGKKCHGTSCAIFAEVGNCVMPKEGIFARVLKGGKIRAGMPLTYHPRVYKGQVITLSDRASQGTYEDRSGPRIMMLLQNYFDEQHLHLDLEHTIIPDEPAALITLLERAKMQKDDFLFTTGGTGIGRRDITPEVVRPMLDKEIPGIMESIRLKYGTEKPNALLSRGISGLMDNTLVYTLPGSVKAVNEYMEEILKTIRHLILMLHEIDSH